jgi:hypothetical protein
MIGPEHESPRPATGEGFADIVSFAFGDPESALFGIARVGLSPAPPATGSALALMFSGRDPVAARVRSGIELAEPDWKSIELAGVTARTIEPLASWQVAFAGDGAGFELQFSALSEPLAFGVGDADGGPASGPGSGMEGYEQLCRVEGHATVGDERLEINCLGQRGHSWGASDWRALERVSTVAAWLEDDRAVALKAFRPEGKKGHDADVVRAFLVEEGSEGAGRIVTDVAEPRLSTTYDAEGHQRRAGLELWLDEESELPRRAAGEALCGTSLEVGALQLDCAFFAWTMEGRAGVGPYEVLRRR